MAHNEQDHTVTAEDIRREHADAIASLTPTQKRALDRRRESERLAHFNHYKSSENLETIFESEAAQRNTNLQAQENLKVSAA